jgi:UDP-N-acetylglucosamine:LPS N-acetylglucosamine transferase
MDGADTSHLVGERIFFARGPTERSLSSLARNAWMAWRLVRQLRPSVILMTGAGLCVPFAWAGRFFGARIVYVECSGRVGISLSGRLVAPVADRFYVQWPDVVPLMPKAMFRGTVFFSPQ